MDDTTIMMNVGDLSVNIDAALPAAILGVGKEMSGVIFDLAAGDNFIGRHLGNRICINIKGTSRKHCMISVLGKDCVLADLDSSNGTFVNERKIERNTILRKGDIISIGTEAFKFLPAGDLERQTYQLLREEADTDPHTQCFNKGFMSKALQEGFRHARISAQPLSLIMFDLDHFKHLNDNFGHDAGDFVLKSLADVVRKYAIRRGDIFVRFGGEEFVILLPNTLTNEASAIAQRLCLAIETHNFIYEETLLPVTASVGVAQTSANMNDESDLFKLADQTLYAAKNAGRNCVRIA